MKVLFSGNLVYQDNYNSRRVWQTDMLRSITTRLTSPISGSLRCLSVACCNTQMAVPMGMPMGMPIGMTAGIPTGSLGLPVQENNHMTEPIVSITDLIKKQEEYRMDSVMRKRRTKMKKHKLRKRRKRQKAEKRKQSQG